MEPKKFITIPINMKFLRIVTLLLMLGPGISCQSTSKMGSVSDRVDNFLVISMKKTACYGSCPVYEIEIFSNLEVKYLGEKFVDKTGKYTARITQQHLDDLKSTFDEAAFFEMEDEYVSAVSDLPTTYVYYSDGKKFKKIKDYTGAPEELKSLERKISELLNTLKWSRVEN